MRTSLLAAYLSVVLSAMTIAGEPSGATARDDFPTGAGTPEGAACDLARAFIRDDSALFLATCVPPYGSPEGKQTRHQFLQSVVVQMKLDPAGGPPALESPKGISKCFAARHLRSGSVAANAAAADFQDVMFVDVSALLRNGATQLCRTLVVKTKDGRWLVDPQPELSPALSSGLDDETPSTQEVAMPDLPK